MRAFLLGRHRGKMPYKGSYWYYTDDGIDVENAYSMLSDKRIHSRILRLFGQYWYIVEIERYGRKHYIAIETEKHD